MDGWTDGRIDGWIIDSLSISFDDVDIDDQQSVVLSDRASLHCPLNFEVQY